MAEFRSDRNSRLKMEGRWGDFLARRSRVGNEQAEAEFRPYHEWAAPYGLGDTASLTPEDWKDPELLQSVRVLALRAAAHWVLDHISEPLAVPPTEDAEYFQKWQRENTDDFIKFMRTMASQEGRALKSE